MKSTDESIKEALEATGEGLWDFIRDPRVDVVANALLNRNLSEDMAVFIAKRRNMSAEVLGYLAGDVRFRESYPLKRALCRNPRTPQRVVLSLLKFMKLFDLADISRDQNVQISIRQKIEQMIAERIRSMPLGVKTALARRASHSTLLALMESGDEKVVRVCLESPSLTEGQVYKIINRPLTKAPVIKAIAEHPKWSLPYPVRFSLVRNFHTPLTCASVFIHALRTVDLKELYSDPKVPLSSKPFIFRELGERGEVPDMAPEEVHVLPEDDDLSDSDGELNREDKPLVK